jgi:hypothetical protein
MVNWPKLLRAIQGHPDPSEPTATEIENWVASNDSLGIKDITNWKFYSGNTGFNGKRWILFIEVKEK